MNIEFDGPLSFLPVYQLHGSKWWVVLDDYQYEMRIDGIPTIVTIPGGYRYDRATIWWEGLIKKDSLGCKGPLIHDALCHFKGKFPDVPFSGESIDTPHIDPYRTFTRQEADTIFREVMIQDRIKAWRAWTAWSMVGALTLVKHW